MPTVSGDEVFATLLEPEFEPLILGLSDWLSAVADLFADVLGLILSTPVLRFFAVFGVFLSAFGLAWYFVRTGKTLAH